MSFYFCLSINRIPHPTPWLLAPLLTTYESSTKASQFAQTSYLCSICLTAYKGAKCLRLSCDHVFCRSCLGDFWKLCIAEGDVGRVGCPDPECVKADREANEEEVARVVTEDEVHRWKWLREKISLEKGFFLDILLLDGTYSLAADPTVIHCPMTFCQRPVLKPDNGESEESGWDRLRICEACSYSFCSFCKRTW
jgi:E3 ubiquitin-protein ligase RNF14